MNTEISENDIQKAFAKSKVVLLDVAGTTTSTKFVEEVLFTYASENAEPFLKEHWEAENVKTAIKQLLDGKDIDDVEEAIKSVKDGITKKTSNAGLKSINGLIYKKGYEDGTLKAHLYPDVSVAFTAWSKNKKIAIFSTGSVDSQKLLFKYSVEGDLSSHVSHYFDQSVGLKTACDTYKKIVEELSVAADEVLWISDLKDELSPAKEAGLSTILITREPVEDSSEFLKISSFAELTIDVSNNKRKNEEDTNGLEEVPPSKISKKEISADVKENSENATTDTKTDSVEADVNSALKTETVEVDKSKLETNDSVEIMDVQSETNSKEVEKEPKLEINDQKSSEVSSDETKDSKLEEKTSTESIVQMEVETVEPESSSEPIVNPVVTETLPEKMDTEERKTDIPECTEKKEKTESTLNGTVESNADTENKVESNKAVETTEKDSEVSEQVNQETVESTGDAKKPLEVCEKIETKAVNNVDVIVSEPKSEATSESVVSAPAVDTTSAANHKESEVLVKEAKDVVVEAVVTTSDDRSTNQSTEENVAKPNDLDKEDVVTNSNLTEESKETNDTKPAETLNDKVESVSKNETVEENIPNGKEVNGESNGINGCEPDTTNSITNGESKVDTESHEEVKVKKLDTTVESSTVSIEA